MMRRILLKAAGALGCIVAASVMAGLSRFLWLATETTSAEPWPQALAAAGGLAALAFGVGSALTVSVVAAFALDRLGEPRK